MGFNCFRPSSGGRGVVCRFRSSRSGKARSACMGEDGRFLYWAMCSFCRQTYTKEQETHVWNIEGMLADVCGLADGRRAGRSARDVVSDLWWAGVGIGGGVAAADAADGRAAAPLLSARVAGVGDALLGAGGLPGAHRTALRGAGAAPQQRGRVALAGGSGGNLAAGHERGGAGRVSSASACTAVAAAERSPAQWLALQAAAPSSPASCWPSDEPPGSGTLHPTL